MKKYVRNCARPKGSIVEAYIATEALTFCSMYLTDIETRFNKPEGNWIDEDAHAGNIFVFQTLTRLLRKMSQIKLDDDLWNRAEWCILQNCHEIQHYIEYASNNSNNHSFF